MQGAVYKCKMLSKTASSQLGLGLKYPRVTSERVTFENLLLNEDPDQEVWEKKTILDCVLDPIWDPILNPFWIFTSGFRMVPFWESKFASNRGIASNRPF